MEKHTNTSVQPPKSAKPSAVVAPKEKIRKSEAGKGDCPRPLSVSQEEYSLRWQLIFCHENKKRKELINKIEKLKRNRL
jgi:ribosomal protein L44E